jgi:hypothetical protein
MNPSAPNDRRCDRRVAQKENPRPRGRENEGSGSTGMRNACLQREAERPVEMPDPDRPVSRGPYRIGPTTFAGHTRRASPSLFPRAGLLAQDFSPAGLPIPSIGTVARWLAKNKCPSQRRVRGGISPPSRSTAILFAVGLIAARGSRGRIIRRAGKASRDGNQTKNDSRGDAETGLKSFGGRRAERFSIRIQPKRLESLHTKVAIEFQARLRASLFLFFGFPGVNTKRIYHL